MSRPRCIARGALAFNRRAACVLLVLAALSVAVSLGGGSQKEEPAGGAPNVQDLAQQASFVFKGTVKELHASTLPVVRASDSTVIVHVDEVLQGAKTVGDFTGQEITVQLKTPGSVKVGDQLTFFTNVGAFGKSVSVVEVGHVAAIQESAKIREQIGGARQAQLDARLQKRLAQADLVVVGKVTATKAVARQPKGPPRSEHDPEWQEATIQIQQVEKGKPGPGGTVTVFFAGSRDIRWYGSPKLKVGQEAIFLLHQTDDPELGVKGYTVLDPLDVQPKEQLDHIKKLMQAGR